MGYVLSRCMSPTRMLYAVVTSLILALGSAAPADAARLTLNWTVNSNNESGFSIERRAEGGSFAVIANIGPAQGAYVDVTLASGKTYCYRVRAFNAAGYSSYSNEACAVSVDTGSPPPMPPGGAAANIAAAVLPSSRSVQVGQVATAYATILNAGPATATACGLWWPGGVPGDFMFQTTDPATNALVGTPNQPVDIPPGTGQTFLFSFAPSTPIAPTLVAPTFACANTPRAPGLAGVSTLLFSASATPIPDIVALSATLRNDGIVTVAPGTGMFAVASVNVGVTDTVTASVDTGDIALPLVVAICPTDAATGVCLAPPAPTATVFSAGGSTGSFAVFVQAAAPVPFDPARSRIFVRFTDSTGAVRGATSVAVRTP